MGKSKGEGRAKNEKSQRVVESSAARKARRDKIKAEEEEWASKSGPVEVRKVDEQ